MRGLMLKRVLKVGGLLLPLLLSWGLGGISVVWGGDIDLIATTSNGQTSITFQNVAGSTLAVITSAGNVGIGTTSPATKLHMSTGTLTIDGSTAGMTIGVSTFGVTGGNVGIGTKNPTYSLTVSSYMYVGGYISMGYVLSTSNCGTISGCSASCASNAVVITGGCQANPGQTASLVFSYPTIISGAYSWQCNWNSNTVGATATVICGRLAQ